MLQRTSKSQKQSHRKRLMALLLLLWLSIELLEIKVIKEAFMMNVEFLFFSRIEICGTKVLTCDASGDIILV